MQNIPFITGMNLLIVLIVTFAMMPLHDVSWYVTSWQNTWLHGAARKDTSWTYFSTAVKEARNDRKPLLVYVHAPWCGPCLKMEQDVFPEVEPLLNRFTRTALDFDDNESIITAYGKSRSPFAWATHLGATATPSFILLTPDGSIITTTTGFIDARGFSILLSYAATKAYQHATIEEYATSIHP